jgi:hypothetical protein
MEIRLLLRETQCKLTIFILENTRVILKNLICRWNNQVHS